MSGEGEGEADLSCHAESSASCACLSWHRLTEISANSSLVTEGVCVIPVRRGSGLPLGVETGVGVLTTLLLCWGWSKIR